VKFGGKRILNINEYTYALDGAKIGQPVEVVVQRDGKEVTLKVTPEQRQ
jgi:S1-C subfamily serine protease